MGKPNGTNQDSVYELDAYKRGVAEFLLRDIIPVIARKADSDSDRKQWVNEVSFAVVSGVLVRLAKKYPGEVEKLFSQAEKLITNFTIEDLKNNPKNYLPERLKRWIDKFKELPQYPRVKKSPNTGDKKRHKLNYLLEYEESIEKLRQIFKQKDNFKDKSLLKGLRKCFPDLSKADAIYFGAEIEWTERQDDKYIRGLALSITAKSLGFERSSFERHYLVGTKKESKDIDKALTQR